jgi:hypothetical protein
MNYRVFVFLTIICCCVCTSLFAAPFQNLDFEQGSFQAPPANYTPSAPLAGPFPISAAAGLPFWTAREDSTICTAIWGNVGGLNETSVVLLSSAVAFPPPSPAPLDGIYSAGLTAYANAPSGFFTTASISQIGDVPANAKSIQFLMVAGSNPLVTLNGSAISLIPISTNGNLVTMGGDVIAFAGTNAELTITAAGTPGGNSLLAGPFVVMDDIVFSPNPVPEPSAIALLILGGVGLLMRRR